MNFQKLNGESTPNKYISEYACVIMRNSNRPFIPSNDYNEWRSEYTPRKTKYLYTCCNCVFMF